MDTSPAGLTFGRADLLRWLYVGRLTVTGGIFAGAVLAWFGADRQQTLIATVMFVGAVALTVVSFWNTHIRGAEPSTNFIYVHVVADALLATGIVHITGGMDSSFAPLYVLVISEGALLLPLSGGVLVGALATILYFADLFWFDQASLTGMVAYQVLLFSAVALVTGFLGDRLRRAGMALGAVQSELRQLRLDTGDILESLSSGVITVDEGGRLVYLNDAAAAMLGLRPEVWQGSPVISAVDEAAPGLGQILRRSLDEGVPIARYRTSTEVGGVRVALDVSTTLLGAGGERTRSATAILRDVSEVERIEALNRRAARLEAVAELSASLAHEIKNPLASIRSAVEQIARPVPLDEADRETLKALVLSESDRLSRLLSEFLDFSGLAMSRREKVDMVELVQSCVSVVRQHPDCVSGVDLAVTYESDDVTVLGDSDLLHRAFFNLVLNAVQFSAPVGRVSIRLSKHTGIEGVGVRDIARLAVRDSGPGIDPEEAARVFDPFFTRREGGSGLGLAVVHRSIQAHDGTVVINHPPEGGAEFVVELPLHVTPARSKAT